MPNLSKSAQPEGKQRESMNHLRREQLWVTAREGFLGFFSSLWLAQASVAWSHVEWGNHRVGKAPAGSSLSTQHRTDFRSSWSVSREGPALLANWSHIFGGPEGQGRHLALTQTKVFLLLNKTLTSRSAQNFLLEVRVKQEKLWAQAVLCPCPRAGAAAPNQDFCEAKLVCGHGTSQNGHTESQEGWAVALRARSPPSPKPTPLLAPSATEPL